MHRHQQDIFSKNVVILIGDRTATLFSCWETFITRVNSIDSYRNAFKIYYLKRRVELYRA